MTGASDAPDTRPDIPARGLNRRRGTRDRLLLTARALGVVTGAALALWGAPMALDEVVFHGFSPNCSDGNPSYDPRYCGVTWRPGFPALATAVIGLLLLAVSVWRRRFTGRLLVAAGVSTALVALFLLWTQTWVPVTPAFPEPGAPQYAQLVLGVLTAVAGLAVLRPRGADTGR
jgi:hypothetical protein